MSRYARQQVRWDDFIKLVSDFCLEHACRVQVCSCNSSYSYESRSAFQVTVTHDCRSMCSMNVFTVTDKVTLDSCRNPVVRRFSAFCILSATSYIAVQLYVN